MTRCTHPVPSFRTSALIAAAMSAGVAAAPAPAVDWLFTEDFQTVDTSDLISVDGLLNRDKSVAIHDASPVPATFEAQGGLGSPSTVISTLDGNNFLDLTTSNNSVAEAFTVVSSGEEANAPRDGMAATSVRFRVDSSSGNSFGSRGHHISFYRRLLHDGTSNEGPWQNNLGTLSFRNISPTNGTFRLFGNGYVSPFGVPPESEEPDAPLYEPVIAEELSLDTWYTAELYLPAFNVAGDEEQVLGQYRILSGDGTELLAYTPVRTFHNLHFDNTLTFSTEGTPEVVGIQTINNTLRPSNWQVDDVRVGVGTGDTIDSIFANIGAGTGNYYDFNFDGLVDSTDVDVYVTDYLLTQIGDVDLDRDVDNDDLALAQANLNNAGGWDDGDLTGDGQVTAEDIAIIEALLGGGPGGIIGDYDDSGQVEQGDLNLVLNNWGAAAPFDPNGDPFTTPNVDQEELNRVLNNWGSTAAPSFEGSAVPEPATLALLGGLALAGLRRRGA